MRSGSELPQYRLDGRRDALIFGAFVRFYTTLVDALISKTIRRITGRLRGTKKEMLPMEYAARTLRVSCDADGATRLVLAKPQSDTPAEYTLVLVHRRTAARTQVLLEDLGDGLSAHLERDLWSDNRRDVWWDPVLEAGGRRFPIATDLVLLSSCRDEGTAAAGVARKVFPALTPGGRLAFTTGPRSPVHVVDGDFSEANHASVVVALPPWASGGELRLAQHASQKSIRLELSKVEGRGDDSGLWQAMLNLGEIAEWGKGNWWIEVVTGHSGVHVIGPSPRGGACPQIIARTRVADSNAVLYSARDGGLRLSVGQATTSFLKLTDSALASEVEWREAQLRFIVEPRPRTGLWRIDEISLPHALGLRGRRNPRLFRVPAEVSLIEGQRGRYAFSCPQSALENACRLAGQDAQLSLLVDSPLGELELPIGWKDHSPVAKAKLAPIDVPLSSGDFFVASCTGAGSLALSYCAPEDIEAKRRPIDALLESVQLQAGSLKIKGRACDPAGSLQVDFAEVSFTRQNTDITFSCPGSLGIAQDGEVEFSVQVDVQQLLFDSQLGSGKWHVRLLLHLGDGRQLSARIRRPLNGFARRHAFKNYGEFRDESTGLLIFPELTVPGHLVLAVRMPTEADTPLVRRREKLALVLALLVPNIHDRKSWLITEKKADTAQDNSFVFFQYCYDTHPEKLVYYLIRRESAHRAKLGHRVDRAVDFGSLRHFMLLLRCGVLVSSEASAHFLEFDAVPSVYKFAVRLKKYVFLQHGVTAMKNVAGIFGRKGQWSSDRFITTSAWEQKIAGEFLHYPPEEAPVTGFARWDLLEDRSAGRRQIMVMPTWRNWLHHNRPEQFEESDFFRNYRDFVQSAELVHMLEEHEATLVFVLHPYLEKFSESFRSSSPRVQTVEAGARPVNELMMESSMLISDYSSVVWDFFKMKKPVVFFQFDSDEYLKQHGSFIDLEKDLIGPRAVDVPSLLDEVRSTLEADCKLLPQYQAAYERTFDFDDRNNCERIYRVVEELEHDRFLEVRKLWRLITKGKSGGG